MKSIMIIRFHYEEKDPRFAWRFKYFKEEVLPKILDQSDSDFDIGIRCNPAHNELFKSLSPRIIPFQVKNEGARYKQGKNKKYFHDFVPWEDVVGLEKYDLQMGLDSDDLIHPDYVSIIKQFISHQPPGNSVHISFQPIMFRLKTKKYTKMMEYGPKKGSAFLALYQPNKENYKFIYHDSHITMWKYADLTMTIPEGYCWATAHDINESTGK